MKQFKLSKLLALAMMVILIAGAFTALSCSPDDIDPVDDPDDPVDDPDDPDEPAEPEIPVGGDAVYAIFAEPSKIDPHITASNQAALICAQVFETLVSAMPEGQLAPGLAASWELSDDGLEYTFQLREGVTFHDGEPFNAEAVKYNIERILAPETMSEEAINFLGPFDRVEVDGPMTVTMYLHERFEPFLLGLADPRVGMISPKAAEEHGVEGFQDVMIGTGPFMFEEWRRREHVRVVRNPDYTWAPPEVYDHPGPAYLDAITFKFVPEPLVRAGMLETGEAHMTEHIAATDFPRLDANPDIETIFIPIQGTPVNLLFNASKAPTDDLLVRQAMSYAIDQKAIVDTLYPGLYEPGTGPLDPGARGYWPGVEDYYPHDLDKADQLLDEAGWTMNQQTGIREKNGQQLEVVFPYHSGYPLYADPVLMVESQLRDVGFSVVLEGGPAPSWLAAGREGNHNIGIVHWTSKAPYCLTNLYHSDNITAFAWTRHDIPRIDEILDDLPREMDPDVWESLTVELQQLIMDNALMKPLNTAPQIFAYRQELNGVRFVPGTHQQCYYFTAYLDN